VTLQLAYDIGVLVLAFAAIYGLLCLTERRHR